MGLTRCPGCCVIQPQNFLRALFPGRQPGEKTEPAGQYDISFPTEVCNRMVRIVRAHWLLMVLTYIGQGLSSGLWVIHDQCQFLSFSWCEFTCQLSPLGALNVMLFLPIVFEVSKGDDKYCLSREPLAISTQSSHTASFASSYGLSGSPTVLTAPTSFEVFKDISNQWAFSVNLLSYMYQIKN